MGTHDFPVTKKHVSCCSCLPDNPWQTWGHTCTQVVDAYSNPFTIINAFLKSNTSSQPDFGFNAMQAPPIYTFDYSLTLFTVKSVLSALMSISPATSQSSMSLLWTALEELAAMKKEVSL